jgi:hypothetical protein
LVTVGAGAYEASRKDGKHCANITSCFLSVPITSTVTSYECILNRVNVFETGITPEEISAI